MYSVWLKPGLKVSVILTSCITVWYGACNASCRKTLQRIVRAAEKIVGVSLPSLQVIYSTRLTRKALCIAGDPTHPTHSFFSLLPSGRRLRILQARTSRLKDSFIHQAVRKLNSLPSLPPSSLLPHAPLNSDTTTPPQLPTSPGPSTPPPTYKLWPAPVTLCSMGLITTSSSIDCKLPLSDSLIKDCSLSSYHFNRLISSFALHIISAVLFLTGLHYLPCAYATLSISFFFYNVLICISV